MNGKSLKLRIKRMLAFACAWIMFMQSFIMPVTSVEITNPSEEQRDYQAVVKLINAAGAGEVSVDIVISENNVVQMEGNPENANDFSLQMKTVSSNIVPGRYDVKISGENLITCEKQLDFTVVDNGKTLYAEVDLSDKVLHRITGKVKEWKAGVLEGVSVSAKNENIEVNTTTNQEGIYSLKVPKGTYTIFYTKDRYQDEKIEGLGISGNTTLLGVPMRKLYSITVNTENADAEDDEEKPGGIVSVSCNGVGETSEDKNHTYTVTDGYDVTIIVTPKDYYQVCPQITGSISGEMELCDEKTGEMRITIPENEIKEDKTISLKYEPIPEVYISVQEDGLKISRQMKGGKVECAGKRKIRITGEGSPIYARLIQGNENQSVDDGEYTISGNSAIVRFVKDEELPKIELLNKEIIKRQNGDAISCEWYINKPSDFLVKVTDFDSGIRSVYADILYQKEFSKTEQQDVFKINIAREDWIDSAFGVPLPIYAEDKVGNVVSENSLVVYYDEEPPKVTSVSINSPALCVQDGILCYSKQDLQVSLGVSDNTLIKKVDYVITNRMLEAGVPDEAVAGIFYNNAPSGSKEFPEGHDPKKAVDMTLPLNSNLPSGKYYLYFAATDMAGNRQKDRPVCVPIIIDKDNPDITSLTGKQEEISGENNWYKADDEFVFHAVISDNHTWSSMQARYQLVKEGEEKNFDKAEVISINDCREIELEGSTGGAYEVTIMPDKPQQDGTYVLYVWARDGCANASAPSVYTIHYDTQNPLVGNFLFNVKKDNTFENIFTKFGNFFRLNKQPNPQTVTICFKAEDVTKGYHYTQVPQIQKLTLWYLTEEDCKVAETATLSDVTVEIPGSMPAYSKKVTEFNKKNDGIYETEIKGLENNRFYRIMIEAEDCAGNITYAVPSGNDYDSDLVMIDQTNPGVVLAPTKEFETPDYVQNKNGKTKNWYSAEKKVAFKASAEDKDSGIFKMSMQVNGNKDKMSEDTLTERLEKSHSMEINVFKGKIEADGKYEFSTQVIDNAGNISEDKKTIYVDEDAPKISKVEFASGAVDEMEVVPMQYGFFFKKKTVVTVEATDYIGKSKKEASGVKTITYYLEDEDKKTTEEITVAAKAGAKNTYTTSFTVPAGFKGQIYVKATDNVGQSSTFVYPKGTVIDSAQEHKNHSYAKIVMEQTAYRDENNNPLYNHLPTIQLRTKDTKSGIAKNTWQVKAFQDVEPEGKGTLTIETQYDEKNDKFVSSLTGDEGWKTPGKLDLNLVTRADKTYQVRSERNAVEARLKLTDHAGNSEKATKKVFSVDMTAPQVTVEYDNNDVYNEKYYKKERYATIKVIDANFSAEKCEIRVEGPAVTKSDWEHTPGTGCNGNIHTKDCTYTCVVGFVDDGEYTFGFTCTDLAGWKGSYDQTDEFVIDMTEPLIRVDYDNDDVRNGHYYKETRTATVQIEEHNFEADDVVITMTASDKGSPLAVPQISGWSHNEDFHTATIAYDYDGEFTFDIEYTDLADNDAAEYEQDHFIIDTTEPELEIMGVKNYSANKGKVEPVVSGKDKYMEDMVVTLTGSLGGTKTPEYKKTQTGDTTTYAFEDTGYKKENDDIYTLHVAAIDRAGNEVEEEIVYSVNRFGSVYEYDENTKKLIEDYYTSEVKDLVIREVNVNSLKVRRITYSKDGEIVTLKEGDDYRLQEKGTKDTWKEYIYTIYGETFEEEGKYILTLYSEDEANNRSDNKVKGKEIEFVVDRTAPDFVLSGIEDGGRYREESREFIVNVADNMGVSKLEIYNDGKLLASFDSEEILEKNGTLSVPLQGKNDWQSIKVVTYDMAGNRSESAPVSYLITTNVFVQWYKNKWAVMGTAVLILLLAGGTAAIWAGKKKKAAA